MIQYKNNMKNSNFFNLFLSALLIMSMACTENTKTKSDTTDLFNVSKPDILSFHFKDTVIHDKDVRGTIQYNLNLKNITISEISERFVFLHVITDNKDSLRLKDINSESIKYHSFVDTIGNGTINFKTKFNKLGSNAINLIIEDKIILKNKDSLGNTIILAKELNLYKNIYVEDNNE